MGFERLGTTLPFLAPDTSEEPQLNRIRTYVLQIWLPEGYDLVTASPQPYSFQFIGDLTRYFCEIDVTKTDFYVRSENPELASEKERRLAIFSSLFGIGLALAIRETVAHAKLK